jgi:hypothetical protein
MTNCPDKKVDHQSDIGMIVHGSKEGPLRIDEPKFSRQIQWEYAQIGRELGFHRVCGQSLLNPGKTFADRIVVRTASGTHHAFYYDVTEKILSEGKELVAAYEAMKKDPNLDPEMKKLIADEEARERERRHERDKEGTA